MLDEHIYNLVEGIDAAGVTGREALATMIAVVFVTVG
jgi:hypothetical protein